MATKKSSKSSATPIRKKTTRPVMTESTEEAMIVDSTLSKNSGYAMKVKKSYIAIALSLLLVVGLLYYFKHLFVVATVNGQPITRLSFIQELEKQGGKQTLESMVTRTLILQEAKKKNIDVSKEEIDKEVKQIEDNLSKQGQNLDQLLSTQNGSRDDFREQIRVQKLVEKLLGKEIEVTDKEVADYLEANKASLPEGTDPNSLKDSVKQQLKQQKLNEKFQSFLEATQKNAKINYFLTF